jgi:hypothetical protein
VCLDTHAPLAARVLKGLVITLMQFKGLTIIFMKLIAVMLINNSGYTNNKSA